MAQVPLHVKVAVATAGTRVALATTTSPYRYVRSVTVEAKFDNKGRIFLGSSSVASTLYTAVLNGSDKDRTMTINGDPIDSTSGSFRNCVDLAAWYVDCESGNDGDSVMVTVELNQ